MQNLLKTSAVTILALLAFGAVDANAQGGGGAGGGGGGGQGPVQCPADSLQAAIDGAAPGTTIFVEGTCVEDVTVTTDDITLNGDANGDTVIDGTISGTITIDGARRVVIDFLTVTGPGPGIVGTDTAAFTVQNSDISNNGIGGGENDFGTGINVLAGSSALITNNEISGNQADGIFVDNASSARVKFNMITGNGRTALFDAGIDVARSGVVKTRGNTITDNGYAAIQAFDQGNIANGFFVAGGAGGPGDDTEIITQKGCPGSCDPDAVAMEFTAGSITLFRNAAITGTVSVGLFSTMRIRTSTITGPINVFTSAGVQLKSTMDFTGTLQCSGGSFTFFGSAVQCGQTCSGAVPGTCLP